MKKLITIFFALSLTIPAYAGSGYDDRDEAWWNQNATLKTSVPPKTEYANPEYKKPAIEAVKPIAYGRRERQDKAHIAYAYYGVFVALLGLICMINEGNTPRFVHNFVRINTIVGGYYLYHKFFIKKFQ